MPTDEEILSACELVVKWYDGPGTAQKQFESLRALFARAQPEPERMSVRLQLAGMVFSGFQHRQSELKAMARYCLGAADALIDQDAQDRARSRT